MAFWWGVKTIQMVKNPNGSILHLLGAIPHLMHLSERVHTATVYNLTVSSAVYVCSASFLCCMLASLNPDMYSEVSGAQQHK